MALALRTSLDSCSISHRAVENRRNDSGLPAHGHRDAQIGCQRPVLPTRILRPAITIYQQRLGWLALPPRRFQGCAHLGGINGLGHRPVHDAPASQVHHRRHVQPALTCGHVRDVRCPGLIGLPAIEASIQQTGSHRQSVRRVGGTTKGLLYTGRRPWHKLLRTRSALTI